MAIQMVPVTQIGFALGNNLWTEELPHGTTEDSGKVDIGLKNFLPPGSHHFQSNFFFNAAEIYIHTSEQIPSNHSVDIVTPPPDIV